MHLIDFNWYALQVRPKFEGRVAQALATSGYQVLFPTFPLNRVRHGRSQQVRAPMFLNYVFCRYQSALQKPIVTTPGVIRIVGFDGKPAAIQQSEIAAIQILETSGMTAQPWQYIAKGKAVRVIDGPLAGLEGIFLSGDTHERVIISVKLLQRSLMIKLTGDQVAPIYPVPCIGAPG